MAAAKHLTAEDASSEFDANVRRLFDSSVVNVQSHFSRIQEAYLVPAYKRAKAFSHVYPVLSLYIAISTALSLFPIVTFLCTSIFILSASVFVVVIVTIALSALIIGFFAIILFFALFSISLLSIALTLTVLGAYQLARLISHVREQPTWSAGIRQWRFELRKSALARLPDAHQGEDTRASSSQVDGVHVSDGDAYTVLADQRNEASFVKTDSNGYDLLAESEG